VRICVNLRIKPDSESAVASAAECQVLHVGGRRGVQNIHDALVRGVR
jgi:hypothetical protein